VVASGETTFWGRRMNVYFEIADSAVEQHGHKYCAMLNINPGEIVRRDGLRRILMSDRVWKEDNNGNIKFLRNRFAGQNSSVDIKEFVWVKLKSRQLN
jgi:hypothetical protein